MVCFNCQYDLREDFLIVFVKIYCVSFCWAVWLRLSWPVHVSKDCLHIKIERFSKVLQMLFDKASTEWENKPSTQNSASLACGMQRPFSYADVVASPCDSAVMATADDVENSPPASLASVSLIAFYLFFLAHGLWINLA